MKPTDDIFHRILLLIAIASITSHFSDAQISTEWRKEFPDNHFNENIHGGTPTMIRSHDDMVLLLSEKEIENEKNIEIIKIDDEGNIIWKFSYLENNHSIEKVNCIGLDPYGDIIVGGSIKSLNNNSHSQPLLFKVNSNGSFLWEYILPIADQSDGYINDLSIDIRHNIYATGKYHNADKKTIVTKLYPGGQHVWTVFNEAEEGLAIKVIDDETIFMVGKSDKDDHELYERFHYDLDGQQLLYWPTANYYEQLNGKPVFDQFGYLYQYSTFGFRLHKRNQIGYHMWSYGDSEQAQNGGSIGAVAFDDKMNTYICGSETVFKGNHTDNDMFILKIDRIGNVVWKYVLEEETTLETANSIYLDAQGNIYASGESTDLNGIFFDGIIVSVAANGTEQWRYKFDTDIGQQNVAFNIIKANGNVYVTELIKHSRRSTNKHLGLLKLSQLTGINEQQDLSDQVKLFPNPTYGELNIQLPGHMAGQLQYDVTDQSGKTIISGSQLLQDHQLTIQTDIDPGLYIITIQTNDVIARSKFSVR